MAYPNYSYPGYQPGYYSQPVPDQLAQLRQGQWPLQNLQQPPAPMQQPPAQPAPMQSTGQGGGILWVRGKEEADSFLVAAGSAVALWDMNEPVIYLRQADTTGKPTTTVYDLVERTGSQTAPQPAATSAPAPSAPQVDLSQYIKRDELEGFREELEHLWDKLEAVQDRIKRPAKAAKPKEDDDNA